MVIGGLPLLAIAIFNHDPALSGSFKELSSNDLLALLYTSLFGSAISYGVFFYNATRGQLLCFRVSFPLFLFLGSFFGSVLFFLSKSLVLSYLYINFWILFLLSFRQPHKAQLSHIPDPNVRFYFWVSSLYCSAMLFEKIISPKLIYFNASSYRFLYLGETFSPIQIVGALVTVAAIYMVNYKDSVE